MPFFNNTIQKSKIYISILLEYIEDIFLPSQGDRLYIESLSPQAFSAQVKKSEQQAAKHVYSLFKYREPLVQKAIWFLKYRGNKKIARLFALLLYPKIVETISNKNVYPTFSSPLLVPLPLSKERYRERGWNQAEMICKELQLLDTHTLFTLQTKILQKVRHTNPQTKLNRKERLNNLKNCFAVTTPDLIKNRNIILLDDVATTGSTITEAMNTLKAARAREIIAFTVGH